MTTQMMRRHVPSSSKTFTTSFFFFSVVVPFLILFVVVSSSSWTTISTAAATAVDIAAETATATATITTASSPAAYVTSCRSVGFDPFTLACTTCDLLSESSSGLQLLDDENLKTKLKEKCYVCCESWKSLDDDGIETDSSSNQEQHPTAKGRTRKRKMNRKYKLAVLVHANVAGYYPSVDELIREDKERILEETRPNSFQIKVAAEDSDIEEKNEMLQMAMMMGGAGRGAMDMMNIEPSTILWYDHYPTNPTSGASVELASLSVDELKQLATESTSLRGMKRDDIREMVLALLPPPQ
eukprot:CAMPEP_0113505958 /NCGR_PEP_ID=MMETSP0014_2-20120614/35627_1 /TAXON_ID=2857 /ORGANISM="Nitzschia sp." /LENGTH=297 /DNA_ID=CAMNT_0000401371 /DNA_START=75 /DNA_END=968 /DNA_ORIENTATION=+ /assembly_acc=CAM_ASM_000159